MDGASPEGTEHAATTQRLASLAVYGAGPVAILALAWLRDRGLIADTPLWLLVAITLGAGVANWTTALWASRHPDGGLQLQVRVAASVLSTAAVIYAAGWGSVLLIAYALGSAELLRTLGPRVLVPNMIWNWVAIALGEAAVALGWTPTMVDQSLGLAIAVTGGLCLTVVTDVLGRSVKATESAERQVRRRSAHFEELIERASDIIGVIDRKGTVVSVSPASLTMLGYAPEAVAGRDITDFLAPEVRDALGDVLQEVMEHPGEPVTVETRLVDRDGANRVVLATLTHPSTDWGDHIIVNLHDMTTQRELERQLRHDARHDPLTGLLNRKAFAQVSKRRCDEAAAAGAMVAMLFIDLDGFKQVNDSFGHETGDTILIETAERLAACAPDGGALARLGGDEFALLLGPLQHPDRAIAVAESVLVRVSDPVPGLPHDVRIGASIGIALRSEEGIEFSSLMRQADEAMYTAKRNGRARWELSTPTQ